MKEQLLKALDNLIVTLNTKEEVIGFYGLGSIGNEEQRLDDYSDLDFFIVTNSNESKENLINNIDWLGKKDEILYEFQNTKDGSKVLLKNGVYAEYAIFTLEEYLDIPNLNERELINKANINQKIKKELKKKEIDVNWLIGECITNLLVGIKRYKRGEFFNANKFISRYALDRIIELIDYLENSNDIYPDYFDKTRRLELNYPKISNELNKLNLGSNNALETASWILNKLKQIYSELNDVYLYLEEEIKKST